MEHWKAVLRLTSEKATLLVTDWSGNDVMKAVLPAGHRHPRALLTILEGSAMWSGAPITLVISVAGPCPQSLATAFFGEGVWLDSALVHSDFEVPRRGRHRRRRIRSLGDFSRIRVIGRND